MSFFSNFPKIAYNSNFGQSIINNVLVTNIFFRTKFREAIKNQSVSYYLYTIRDQDTPEGIAFKYYGNPEAHWVILYANDIVDPFYDWPLSNENFNNYIREKYGSIATTQTTIHHYEKHIRTRDTRTNTWTTRKVIIDLADARTNEAEELPHDDYNGLAEAYYPNISGTFKDGSAIEVVIEKAAISVYDWENERNEAKRNIKLIRKEQYPAIQEEFERLTKEKAPFFREIRGY